MFGGGLGDVDWKNSLPSLLFVLRSNLMHNYYSLPLTL